MARDVPIRIQRGANDPAVVWGFDNADGTAAALAGSRFDLTIAWLAAPPRCGQPVVSEGPIQHTSDPSEGGVLAIDTTAGTVAWPYTVAESLAIPRGSVARYELTRTIGGRTRLWAGGTVIVESFLP